MNRITTTQQLNKAPHRVGDAALIGILFAVCFLALLPVAMLAAMTGWRWQPWPPGVQGYRGIVHEAKNAANTVTAMAFSI